MMLVCEIGNDLAKILDSEFEVRYISGVKVTKAEKAGYVSNSGRASPMIKESVLRFCGHIALLSEIVSDEFNLDGEEVASLVAPASRRERVYVHLPYCTSP